MGTREEEEEDGREEEDGQRVGGETKRDAKPPRRTRD